MSNLPRIAIEGYLRKPDGSPVTDTTVTFTLSHTDSDLSSDSVVLARPVHVSTNDQGFLRAQLWSNDRGFQNSHYEVAVIVSGQATPIGKIRVTEDGSTDLEQLLTEDVVRALDVDEQTLAAAVRAETAAQNTRASQEAAADAVNPAVIRRDTIAAAKPAFPLAPNLLADTKKFATLCGGRVNTETEILVAHNGSSWRAARPNGESRGTLEVVTLQNLAAKGIGFGGDLALAAHSSFYASDFRIALLDVTVDEHEGEDAHTHEHQTILAQGTGQDGFPFFTGTDKGGFKTQAACFVNVVSHSDDITLRICDRIVDNPLIAAAILKATAGPTFTGPARDGPGITSASSGATAA